MTKKDEKIEVLKKLRKWVSLEADKMVKTSQNHVGTKAEDFEVGQALGLMKAERYIKELLDELEVE